MQKQKCPICEDQMEKYESGFGIYKHRGYTCPDCEIGTFSYREMYVDKIGIHSVEKVDNIDLSDWAKRVCELFTNMDDGGDWSYINDDGHSYRRAMKLMKEVKPYG